MINPVLKRFLQRFRTRPALEPVYQALFQRDLRRYGVEDDFYPVGSAANYSLLYLVLRICKEIGPASMLDIGAGQTSILLSRLLGSDASRRLLTVEHDPQWSTALEKRIGHEILLSPLEMRTVEQRQVKTYDWDVIRGRGPFDAILCDGPPGTPRWSRFGIMKLIDETLPESFVIVMDDAERTGEGETIAAIRARLEEMGRQIAVGRVLGQKTQAVIAGGDYRQVAYF